MLDLNKIKKIPIDLLFIKSYYDKILFTHPKRFKLICLFITHLLLLIILYVAPLIYDNIYFNVFYACLIIAMICGWITFNGECWINSWEKKILDPDYKNGDNLDVNPSIDLLVENIVAPIIRFFQRLFKIEQKDKINEETYKYYKNLRYKIPLIIPLMSFAVFLWVRFKFIHIQFRLALVLLFIILTIVAHFKWKSIDDFYG